MLTVALASVVVVAAAKGSGVSAFVMLYYAAGIIVGVGALLGFIHRFVWPTMRRIRNFLTDWEGTPERDGVEAKPGVMRRLHTVEYKLDGVYKELHPNHGGSLRDEVTELVNWKRDQS